MGDLYLNHLSAPAQNADDALEALVRLRRGFGILVSRGGFPLRWYCAMRASELQLTPDFQTLASLVATHGGRYRDTLEFFLRAIDQRMPFDLQLADVDREKVAYHIVDERGLPRGLPGDGTGILVAAALDGGVLLSLGTDEIWIDDRLQLNVEFEEGAAQFDIDNVSSEEAGLSVSDRRQSELDDFNLANWDRVAGGVERSPQVTAWIEQNLHQPGFERLVVRTVSVAVQRGFNPDGDLLKKLEGYDNPTIFEVRAFFRGSNNLRILYTRFEGGAVFLAHAGFKTSPDWYEFAAIRAQAAIRARLIA